MNELKDAVRIIIVLVILAICTSTAIIMVQLERLECKIDKVSVATIQTVEVKENVQETSTEGLIKARCEEKRVDYKVALAIARAETGNFTSKAYKECNNVGGMSVNEIPIVYDTLRDRINAFVDNLANNYFAKGHNTIAKISKKYCPANHDKWTNLVEELANDTAEEVRV